ncbi:hypothetical protein [Modestobacter lacusdianchii]
MTLAPTPGPEDGETLRQVLKVLIATLGGGLGFMVGGPGGAAAVAGATEGAGVALDVLAHRMRQRSASNASGAVDVALDASCMSEAQLIDALTRDPSACLLATTALNAAAETALQEKVRLMGHVLANAATDAAVVDEELLVARAVRVLEAPHFRVLALLDDPPRFDGDPEGTSTMRWTPPHLAARRGWPQRSVTSVLLTLQSVAAALLSPSTIDGGRASYRELLRTRGPLELTEMHCEITDFGAHLAERIRQAGAKVTGEAVQCDS